MNNYIYDNVSTMMREYWHDGTEHPVFKVYAAYIKRLPKNSRIKPWGFYTVLNTNKISNEELPNDANG